MGFRAVELDSDHHDGGEEEKRPTLKTIAFMTGLGITTVSRALKDAPDIGSDTKKRVRLIADQIGYRPNRAGVRLRTGKTNVISLVLNIDESVMGFVPQLIYGVSDRLARTNYHLNLTPSPSGRDPLDAVRYLVETGSADGIIISRTEPNDRRVRYLLEKGLPFAAHGRTAINEPYPFVDFDNHAFSLMAVEMLVKRGRRSFALIGPPPLFTFYQHMTSGFAEAIERFDLTDIPVRDIDVDVPLDLARERAAALARRKDRPDAIIVAAGSTAIAVISGFESEGLVLGQDFDVVAKETMPMMTWFRPGLITVPENFRAAGYDLADCVIKAIDGVDAQLLQKIVQPEQG